MIFVFLALDTLSAVPCASSLTPICSMAFYKVHEGELRPYGVALVFQLQVRQRVSLLLDSGASPCGGSKCATH